MDASDALRADAPVERSGPMTIAGRLLSLRVAANAVTDADLWLYDEATSVAVIGDLVTLPAPFFETACPARWQGALDEVWAVNCKAPLNMIRCALPHLEASCSGRVVNVASLSGKRVANDHVAYSMSKFAVLALTHSTRRIGWDKGVRATAICPSFVRTDMTASTDKIAPEDMIDPADLAELVATVIALPNTASISELLVNCRLEAMV